MGTILNTNGYDRIFALDTQMIFEARPLAQLDWSSLSAGPILLLILPQVSVEVDARKRDGRLGMRARDLNRLIEPSIDTGGAVIVVEQPVRVDIAYVPAGAIDWSRLDDLERDNGDDRIVAQALHALVDDPMRVELMSFDSRPRAAARRHGLGAVRPEESWLLDPEPSPSDRRVAELERQVRVLQASEPQLRVAIRLLHEPPLVRYQVAPVPRATIDPIVGTILAKNPRRRTGGMMDYGLHRNSNYYEEYDAYAEELGTIDIPNLHLGVMRQFSQYGLEITVENTGVLAAQHVTVDLSSGNALLHPVPYLVDIFGPPPPSTERNLFENIPNLSQRLTRPDRASFILEESEDPAVQVEYRCEDFRHGRTQVLDAVLELPDSVGAAAHVEVRVTAANMRGDVVERLVVPVVVQERILGDLADLDQLVFREALPIKDMLIPLLQDEEERESIARYRNDGSIRD